MMKRAIPAMLMVIGVLSCSPPPPIPDSCPSSLDGPIDGSPLRSEVRVGTLFTFRFASNADARCVQVTVSGPSGTQVVDQSLEATISLDEPGEYTATLSLRSNPTTGSFNDTQYAIATAEPSPNPPCLSLPKACKRVGRSADFVTCDNALFHVDGGLVTTLDGGEWLAADDMLFAWADGELRAVERDGTTRAAISWPEKPSLWSADRQQLAVWNGDAGTRFAASDLAKRGDFSSEHPVEAIAVQPDGGVLRFTSTKAQTACPLVGECANAERAINLGMSFRADVRAANATSVWLETFYSYVAPDSLKLEQADGRWVATRGPRRSFAGTASTNRRGLYGTAWGARLDGQTSGDMRFDGFTGGGSSDDLVWLTDGTTTRVWCE